MSNFSVGFNSINGVEILRLTGELDSYTVPELEAAFQKCRRERSHRIVVDGSDLRYISSAGLGALLNNIDGVRENGGDIKIFGLAPGVFNVFDLVGFPLLFQFAETEEEAVALFGAPPDGSSILSEVQ